MARAHKYFWFDDPYYAQVRGFKEYVATYSDATKLFLQIRDQHLHASMNERDTGKYFTIEHPDPKIQQLLNDYFVHNHYGMNGGRLYSNSYSLVDFFANNLQQTAMYGEMHYYIDWQSKEIKGKKYMLPSSFDYLRPETIWNKKFHDGTLKSVTQKYSLYSKFKHRSDERKLVDVHFKNWEIFYTRYPLKTVHPVKQSMRYLKPFSWFMKYMLWSSEGGTFSKPRSWAVERVRNTRFLVEKRKHDLITAKAYKNFDVPIAVNDLSLTKYYDYFYYARFKARKYKVRQYYVQAFNEQVLAPFAKKNGLKDVPLLKMHDLTTDEEFMENFEQWKIGKLDNETFLTKVVRLSKNY